MRQGCLYRTRSDIRVNGNDGAGSPLYAIIPAGTVAIAVHTDDGSEGIMIEGVRIPCSWSSRSWKLNFEEVDCA